MVKPRLPREWELKLPVEVLMIVYSFVPHLPPKNVPSPSLQRELQKLQQLKLKGKKETYLLLYDDFVLD